MDKIAIILRIRSLHQMVDQECERKLKVLEDCFEMKRECETCRERKECELNFEVLEELAELYKKLDQTDSDRGRYDN